MTIGFSLHLAYRRATFGTMTMSACHFLFSYTFPASLFVTVSMIWTLWWHFPNLTYAIPFLKYSTTSVHSGTNLSKKQRTEGITAMLSEFSDGFAIFMSLCMTVPMLSQLRSSLPPVQLTT